MAKDDTIINTGETIEKLGTLILCWLDGKTNNHFGELFSNFLWSYLHSSSDPEILLLAI